MQRLRLRREGDGVIARVRPFRRLRALWRAWEELRVSDAGRTFARAVRANAELVADVCWWALIVFGVLYFLGRGFVSLRWGI